MRFECAYAEPPVLRHYVLSLDLVPAPDALPFLGGSKFKMRLHFLSLYEFASFHWIRLEEDEEAALIALKLGDLWSDESLPTIVSEAFGDAARETDTESCELSVAGGAGTRTEESMEFLTSVGWTEIRHDEKVVLQGTPARTVWLGEAHFRENTGDTAKIRNRQVVLMRGSH